MQHRLWTWITKPFRTRDIEEDPVTAAPEYPADGPGDRRSEPAVPERRPSPADRRREDQRVLVDRYRQELRVLGSRPVDAGSVVPRDRFAEPDGWAEALALLRPTGNRRVVVLVGAPGTGRRTAALRLLDTVHFTHHPVHEAVADWDAPDARLLPVADDARFLLVLDGAGEAWTAGFTAGLAEYERRAESSNCVLVVVTDAAPRPAAGADVPVVDLGAPSARDVALAWLEGDKERAAWLAPGSGSVFADALGGDARPADGARLAAAAAAATGPDDSAVLDGFRGWPAQVEEWFPTAGTPRGADPSREEAHQMLIIAAAFLDGAPADAVLRAQAELLRWPALHHVPQPGGLDEDVVPYLADLGSPSDETRPVSLDVLRPGISHAVIARVYQRFNRFRTLPDHWLPITTAPGGAAEHHLDRLALALARSHRSSGAAQVLDAFANPGVAAHLLDALAVDPRLGRAVRDEIRGWTRPDAPPARQHAVAGLCGGRTGDAFPVFALDRLREVLGEPDSAARDAGVRAVVALGARPAHTVRVLAELTDWLAADPGYGTLLADAARAALLGLLGAAADRDGPSAGPAPATVLLTGDRPPSGTTLAVLTRAWLGLWHDPETRARASRALDSWCRAAEAGRLPGGPVEEIVGDVITDETTLDADLLRILGVHGAFRERLLSRYLDAARPSDPPPPPPEPASWSAPRYPTG